MSSIVYARTVVYIIYIYKYLRHFISLYAFNYHCTHLYITYIIFILFYSRTLEFESGKKMSTIVGRSVREYNITSTRSILKILYYKAHWSNTRFLMNGNFFSKNGW